MALATVSATASEEAVPAKAERRERTVQPLCRGHTGPGSRRRRSHGRDSCRVTERPALRAAIAISGNWWRTLRAGEPSKSAKRSFDPVSVFLTVLVAIVIVALLVGFIVFATGLIGH